MTTSNVLAAEVTTGHSQVLAMVSMWLG